MCTCMYIPRELLAGGLDGLPAADKPEQTSFDDDVLVGTLPKLPKGSLPTH